MSYRGITMFSSASQLLRNLRKVLAIDRQIDKHTYGFGGKRRLSCVCPRRVENNHPCTKIGTTRTPRARNQYGGRYYTESLCRRLLGVGQQASARRESSTRTRCLKVSTFIHSRSEVRTWSGDIVRTNATPSWEKIDDFAIYLEGGDRWKQGDLSKNHRILKYTNRKPSREIVPQYQRINFRPVRRVNNRFIRKHDKHDVHQAIKNMVGAITICYKIVRNENNAMKK